MYLEYHELLKKYKEACRNYNEALEKKSKLILAVIPGASKIKQVMVDGSNPYSDLNLLNYTDEMDEVDKLINQSRNTRDMLNYELKKLESKMRSNGDVYDKIYCYRWLDHKSVYKFYKLTGYSIRQIYNFISEMKQKMYQN
ncbi:MAG: hypothetical protein IJI98_03365 [Methanosphaera sp.]|nr:hypothetical protein [Methanosphaera sp.]